MRERRAAAQRRAQGINHRDGLHGLAKGAGVVAKRNPNTLAKRRNRAKDELLTQARGDLPEGAEEKVGAGLVLQVHEGQRAILEPLVPGALHANPRSGQVQVQRASSADAERDTAATDIVKDGSRTRWRFRALRPRLQDPRHENLHQVV